MKTRGNGVRPRLRIREDRVDLWLWDDSQLGKRRILIGLAVMTLAFTWLGAMQGAWLAPVVLAGILAIVLSRRGLGSSAGPVVERFVIADTGATRLATETAGVTWIYASEVKRLKMRYVTDKREWSGRFEVWVQFGRSKERLLRSSSLLGFRRGERLATRLAARWNVPLDFDKRSMTAAVGRYRPGQLWGTLLLACLPLPFAALLGYRQLDLRFWPATEATILEYDAGEAWFDGAWYAKPSIRYEYQVGGVKYSSSGWNPSPFNYQSREELLKDAANFAPGARITCWYDPRDPARSYVVNHGITRAPMLLTLASAVLLGLAIWRWRASVYLQRWREKCLMPGG